MRYFDDLAVGSVTECAAFSFTREEIVDFAGRYDPQPFHLDDEAARHSVFGKLTASGLQTTCAGRKLVLQAVFGDRRLLGSPGAMRMQLHKPLFPGVEVRVTHTVKDVRRLAEWPDVAVVEGQTLGYDSEGELMMTLEDLSWVGSRALPEDFDVALLRASPAAWAPLEAMDRRPDVLAQAPSATSGGRLYWDDCPVGRTFHSGEFAVSAADIERFHAQLDPDPRFGGGGRHRHDWHGACLGIPVMGEVFWYRYENAGGPGLDLLQWPHALRAGDRLRGQATIVHSRPLRSRPGIGLTQILNVCVNQSGQVVSSFVSSTFARMRAGH